MKMLLTLSIVGALALAAAPATAAGCGMHGDMPGMMGMHTMPATVTAVDKATGQVDVDSGGMKLHVHFPAASLANVNVGDKITLHMGFTKP
jgi:hypothetical protein